MSKPRVTSAPMWDRKGGCTEHNPAGRPCVRSSMAHTVHWPSGHGGTSWREPRSI